MQGSHWRTLTIGVFGAVVVLLLMGQAPMTVRNDGLQFPDGTVQTTAASTTPMWPMTCYHTPAIAPGNTGDLVCFSYTSGDPGAWGSSNGVPTGYYFLVTDVHVTPQTGVDTGGIADVTLRQRYDVSSVRTGVRFRTAGSLESRLYSARAPFLILPPGDYLDVQNSVNSDYSVEVEVLGYLTADPGNFH